MSAASGSGHLGGSLSIMDILVALYFYFLEHDPKNPNLPSRDRLVYSKAHCCEALYAVLGERGFFPKTIFKSFGEWGSKLQAHSEHWSTPGVEYSGGSLGQGLSYAAGIAWASKRRFGKHKVYCIIGDGESHEGQVWEAALFSSQHKLNNLIVIVDYNRHSTDERDMDEYLSLDPLEAKWKSFNWETYTINNGNDMIEICSVLEKILDNEHAGPVCLIAKTKKGKGVKVWEENASHLMYGGNMLRGIEEWNIVLEKKYKDKILSFPIPHPNYNKEYLEGHWSRIKTGIDMLLDNVCLSPESACLELGSPIPYFSYALKSRYGCSVVCLDIMVNGKFTFNEVVVKSWNICKDKLQAESYDVIIMTEVLEHLPCNLFEVRDNVVSALKTGGYLLVSYPLKGANARDYDKNLLDLNWDSSLDHLREFTDQTAKHFITSLEVIDTKKVYCLAYGGDIVTYLYRKK